MIGYGLYVIFLRFVYYHNNECVAYIWNANLYSDKKGYK